LVVLSGRVRPAEAVPVAAFTVERASTGRAIPAGFVGLSLEMRALEAYAGADPAAVDPVFARLIRNLAPGARPVVRLGGASTDWTWWPIAHMRRPARVRYSLSERWLEMAHALVSAVDGHLIVGVNLAANSRRLAAAEAAVMIRRIGSRWVQALELGNEPELYGGFPWLRRPAGWARRAGYDVPAYVRDFSTVASSLPPGSLAGPSTGSSVWMRAVGPFLAREPRVRMLTLHAYPLQRCGPPGAVTVGRLLSVASTRSFADRLAGPARVAQARGVPVRVDEMNAVSCGGQERVSDTFAAALWSLDALFELARVGVDGVNIHTRPGSVNDLFAVRHTQSGWRAAVRPEYYGLITFARAAPSGSRLLRIAGTRRRGIHVWGTRGVDARARVVLINANRRGGLVAGVRISAAAQGGSLERLSAPTMTAAQGITLGNQSFGAQTATGSLAGKFTISTVKPRAGTYTIRVPAASAAILTVAVP
jgi:hypothetical protein